MGSLTLDPSELVRETRQLDEVAIDVGNQKSWYQKAVRQKSRMQTAVNWPQRVFGEIQGQEVVSVELEKDADTTLVERMSTKRSMTRLATGDLDLVTAFSKLPQTNFAAFDHFVSLIVHQASSNLTDEWNKIFAYIDFEAMPVYISILTLAATEDKSNRLPARRVFVERCRKTLRAMGMADKLFDLVQTEVSAEPRRQQFLKTAHMVACLEEQSATQGYLTAAIRFEKLEDIRSALSCVYRNVRYRMRDNQMSELNVDVCEFDLEEAKIDTMLAVLTATAPIKSRLPSRKLLYRNVHRTLRKRGQLERGLLDGLK